MYTNNTQTDAPRRRAFTGKDDAALGGTKHDTGCGSTPARRREDAAYFRVDSIRSLHEGH